MDFKQAIIENAWGGFSVDYGMLHLQLATPVAVLVIIFIMIISLNKLFFKPILKTLDNRKDTVDKSHKRVLLANEELEKLENEFQQKLGEVRFEVIKLRNTGHESGITKRESMITEKREELELELEKSLNELKDEIEATKSEFSKLNQELSASISKHLLN